MKKNMTKMIAALLSCSMIAVSAPATVMADAEAKIITLGQDLTEDQQNTMLRYFKVDPSTANIIYVNNTQEREFLGSYIPLSKIGSRTLSCAYVKPTSSGGIKVRTANLNYVTCNMLASALSTAGVHNAEVIAACPFEVSGTGALTGVMIAYEDATGTQLSQEKKDLATEELVTTGILGDNTKDEQGEPIGRDPAINIVNQAKIEIIRDDVHDYDTIYAIVKQLMDDQHYEVVESYLQEIVELLQKIADQNYDYSDVKDTLGAIDENLNGTDETEEGSEEASESTDESTESSEDSIFEGIDETVLGDNVIASDTDDASLQEETMPEDSVVLSGFEEVPEEGGDSDEEWTVFEEEAGEPETTTETADEASDESAADESAADESASDASDAAVEAEGSETEAEDLYSQLDDYSRTYYDAAETFADGEYLGDTSKLQEAMGDDFYASALIDSADGEKLKTAVLTVYAKMMIDGIDCYELPEDGSYFTPELNVLEKILKASFSLDPEREVSEEDPLYSYDNETRQALFDDTMQFFCVLYGETVSTVEEWSTEE